MIFAILSLVVSFQSGARADMIGYDDKNCVLLSESRGTMGGVTACRQIVRCEKFALPTPNVYHEATEAFYCRPVAGGRCPKDPIACRDDQSLDASDIPSFKSLPNRPETSQGGTCNVPTSSSSNPWGAIGAKPSGGGER